MFFNFIKLKNKMKSLFLLILNSIVPYTSRKILVQTILSYTVTFNSVETF